MEASDSILWNSAQFQPFQTDRVGQMCGGCSCVCVRAVYPSNHFPTHKLGIPVLCLLGTPFPPSGANGKGSACPPCGFANLWNYRAVSREVSFNSWNDRIGQQSPLLLLGEVEEHDFFLSQPTNPWVASPVCLQ